MLYGLTIGQVEQVNPGHCKEVHRDQSLAFALSSMMNKE